MNKRFILWICCVLLILVPCQGMAEDSTQPKEIALGRAITMTDPLPLSNGNLMILAGWQEGGEHPADSWLICLTPDGDILWEVQVETTHGDLLREDTDGTVLVCHLYDGNTVKQLRRYAVTDGAVVWESARITLTSAQTVKYNEKNDIREYVSLLDDRIFRETVHDSSTTTRPRYCQLENWEGQVLWRFDDIQTGLSVHYGLKSLPQGTLLTGVNYDRDAAEMVALLVDDEGHILWQYPSDPKNQGRIEDALLLKDGTVLMTGYAVYMDGVTPSEKLYLCFDPATCSILWERREKQREERPLRMDGQLETRVGILETDGNLAYDGCAFRLMDFQFDELAYWEMRLPHMGSGIDSNPFLWNGKVWTQVFGHHNREYDTRLIPVELPDGL